MLVFGYYLAVPRGPHVNPRHSSRQNCCCCCCCCCCYRCRCSRCCFSLFTLKAFSSTETHAPPWCVLLPTNIRQNHLLESIQEAGDALFLALECFLADNITIYSGAAMNCMRQVADQCVKDVAPWSDSVHHR